MLLNIDILLFNMNIVVPEAFFSLNIDIYITISFFIAVFTPKIGRLKNTEIINTSVYLSKQNQIHIQSNSISKNKRIF